MNFYGKKYFVAFAGSLTVDLLHACDCSAIGRHRSAIS